MQWQDEYELGISVLDAQHKQLFRLCGELDVALASGIRPHEVEAFLTHMAQYATRHFAMEEKYMADSEYPGLAEQQEVHQAFTTRFGEMYDDFKEKGMTRETVEILHRELIDWVHNHVIGIDQDFGTFYKNR